MSNIEEDQDRIWSADEYDQPQLSTVQRGLKSASVADQVKIERNESWCERICNILTGKKKDTGGETSLGDFVGKVTLLINEAGLPAYRINEQRHLNRDHVKRLGVTKIAFTQKNETNGRRVVKLKDREITLWINDKNSYVIEQDYNDPTAFSVVSPDGVDSLPPNQTLIFKMKSERDAKTMVGLFELIQKEAKANSGSKTSLPALTGVQTKQAPASSIEDVPELVGSHGQSDSIKFTERPRTNSHCLDDLCCGLVSMGIRKFESMSTGNVVTFSPIKICRSEGTQATEQKSVETNTKSLKACKIQTSKRPSKISLKTQEENEMSLEKTAANIQNLPKEILNHLDEAGKDLEVLSSKTDFIEDNSSVPESSGKSNEPDNVV